METRIAVAVLLMMSIFTFTTPVQRIDAQVPHFSPPIVSYNLSNNGGDSIRPDIVASGNNVYAVWIDNTADNLDILFRSSNDNGTSFGSTINLSNNTGISFSPQITAVGGNAYIVWEDDTLGDKEIFFRASNDNGDTFGSTINLSDNIDTSHSPQIVASGSNVYVVWVDYSLSQIDIFFRASNDNGDTFGSTINLTDYYSNNGGVESKYDLQIVASGSNVHVVWHDILYDSKILWKVSNDNGTSFGSTGVIGNGRGPYMVAHENNLYVTWINTSDNGGIFFTASNDNGTSFGSTIKLAALSTWVDFARIATVGSSVHVIWYDNLLGQDDILFRTSNDTGTSFGSTVNLSDNNNTSYSPRIAVAGDNVYVVWVDYADELSRNLVFRTSNDTGTSFGSTVNLSTDRDRLNLQHIATAGNNVYVLWEDYISGQFEILYTRSPPLPPLEQSPPVAPTLRCNGLTATIEGTPEDDIIEGTAGDDVIVALQGNDIINGLGGNDLICSGAGNDEIYGGAGRDKIFAGEGNDVIDGGSGSDSMSGETGDDSVFGADGKDRIFGGEGNDLLDGGKGGDGITGGPGDDRIYGRGGDDGIDCGDGRDFVNGGGGSDSGSNCETLRKIP